MFALLQPPMRFMLSKVVLNKTVDPCTNNAKYSFIRYVGFSKNLWVIIRIYGTNGRMRSASQNTPAIPPVISDLITRISAFPSVQQVILYGSRAKGTQGKFSDIDIAVIGVKNREEWARIHRLADVEDSPVRTLLKIDLARFEDVDPLVQQNIREEGWVLYERH